MSGLRGLVVTPDGEIEEKWFPATGLDFLNALYAAINCDHVEAVRLGEGARAATMYVDENGKGVQLPMPNEYATVLVAGFNHVVYELYFGTAVFLGCPDRHGDDTSLSDKADTYIRVLMTEIKSGRITLRNMRGRRF
ncbi:DUF3846 domain-containing protein [Amycolatopsis sp. cg5]|uniref:DUF3846 domain-containing protein n=1 Tax=Amycolatopsis sp. cg5 TaxID=3238802 RepID=UPI003526B406